MDRNRRYWVIAGLLIALGALIEAVAVSLYWQPCWGSMLTGSVFNGGRYVPEFSNQCLVAMDQAPMFQLPDAGAGWTVIGSLGVAAALLFAASWLVVLAALRLPLFARLIAALPGVLAIAVVAEAVMASLMSGPPADPAVSTLWVVLELSVPVSLIALAVAGVRGPLLARAAIVVLVATATGFVHQLAEYFAVSALSDANWDSPPGAGYLTVIFAVLVAVATVALSGRGDRVGSAVPLPLRDAARLPA